MNFAEASRIEEEAREAKKLAVRNAVSCPKCHAAAGEECVWGSTHALGANHSPRYAKAAKKGI